MLRHWIMGLLGLGLSVVLLLPGMAGAQSPEDSQPQDAAETEEPVDPSSRRQGRVLELIDEQMQRIEAFSKDELRISEHLRAMQRYAKERTRLEDKIARETIVVERLNGIMGVISDQMKIRNKRLLTLKMPGSLIEVSQTMIMDLATQLNDPVRRDIRLAQAEEEVVAIRDSLIRVVSPSAVDKLAENDFGLALDWYLKAQYHIVEPLLIDIVQTYPDALNYDQAMLMLGDIYKFQTRFDEAEGIFATLTTNETTANDVKLLAYAVLEDIYYRQGRWDEAITIYQTVVDQFLLYPEEYDGAIYIGADSHVQKALAGITDKDGPPQPLDALQLALLDSAISIFDQVSDFSPVYILAQQQIAQCYIEQGRLEDAINPLLNAESARPPLWADDIIFDSIWTAMARLGHVYVELARKAEKDGLEVDEILRFRNLAMDQYSKVPQEAEIYDEVLLALAWLEIEKNNTENAVRLLEHLLDVRPDSEYAYEAWITLGDGYTRLRDYEQAEEVFAQLAVTERALALVDSSVLESRDLDVVRRELQRLAMTVESEGDMDALALVSMQLDSLAGRKLRMLELHQRVFETDPLALELVNYGQMKVTLASLSGLISSEKAALNTVSTALVDVERQALSSIRNRDAVSKIHQDTRQVNRTRSVATAFEADIEKGLKILETSLLPGYDRWLKEAAFGKVNIEFTKYQTYKSVLLQQYELVGAIQRDMESIPEDAAIIGDLQTASRSLEAEAEQLEAVLSGTRRSLVAALEEVVVRYPDSQSVEPMLFQLADVQYDQTERNFLEANEAYAAMFDSDEDPGEAPVPDYNTPIRTYERLIREFPTSDFVDQSLFQLGHLLSEQGQLERSNQMFEQLVSRYPDSPMVADAYLRIGDFYFDALFLGLTDLEGEELMRRAIAAYQHMLDNPSNKNFQSALYKLGWSYYNLAAPEIRDKEYDYAIRYFTYLLEDSLRVAEYNQMAELASIDPAPLDPGYSLSGEAIKYIAINFRDRVETGREAERRNWVTVPAAMKDYVITLGQDKPYAKPLMMSMAAVYKETGQVEAEVTALDSLLSLFPNDPEAPQYMQRIIDGYDQLNDMVQVDPEVWDMTAHNGEMPEVYLNRARERLFRDYGRAWAEALEDTAARRKALVLAERAGWRLSNYVASLAELGGNATAGYDRAAQYYMDYLTDFPEGENAYTARWNYAQYMWRLDRYEDAFDEFITVSRDAEHDKYREQAALNAILAAEKMLELESEQAGETSPASVPSDP